jgi:hypothetical protein
MTTEALSEEQTVQTIHDYAAQLITDGLSGPEVERRLLEKGLDRDSASVVVDNLLVVENLLGCHAQALRAQALVESGRKNMLYGLLWFIGGVLVTAFTLVASAGEFGILAYGAIIGGAVQFFVGISRYSKGKKLLGEPSG